MCTKLEVTENNIFVLNHHLLIQKSYLENCDSSAFYYLKDNIFNFIRKNTSDKYGRKRKNKKKTSPDFKNPSEETGVQCQTADTTNNTNEFIVQFCNDVNILRETVMGILEGSQEFLTNFFGIKNVNIEHPIINFDEVNNVAYPKMQGENPFNNFKMIEISGQKYIIPPRCRYFNIEIEELNQISFNNTFDLIVIDPPWRNKYIRRLKNSKFKSNSAYKMLYNNEIQNIPIEKLINDDSLIVIWCTNSQQHQKAILNDFFPKWKLKMITKFYWVKLSKSDKENIVLSCDFNTEFGKKQPFELFYVGCSLNSKKEISEIKNNINITLSIASTIHSHKPPIIELFKKSLPENYRCLELFARYLQPNFTSIGLEVLKLMDLRLYDEKET